MGYAFPLNDMLVRAKVMGARRRIAADSDELAAMAGYPMDHWFSEVPFTMDKLGHTLWAYECTVTCGGYVKWGGTTLCMCRMPDSVPDTCLTDSTYKDPYDGKRYPTKVWSISSLLMPSIDAETGKEVDQTKSPPKTAVCFCFGGDGTAKILVNGVVKKVKVKDLSAGDYVFDGREYSKIIGVEHREEQVAMIKVHFDDGSAITMTEHHLLYNEQNELMQAGELKIGDKLLNDLVVVNVESNLYASPFNALTMSVRLRSTEWLHRAMCFRLNLLLQHIAF